MTNENEFVILLARKSTNEANTQVHSLEYQKRIVQERFSNYTPDIILEISETGDDKERVKFKTQFIDLIKEKLRKWYKVISLAHAIDRFTRNFYDLWVMHRLFKKWAIFLALDWKLETEYDSAFFAMQVTMAQQFLVTLKNKQKAWISQAVREWKYIFWNIPWYRKTNVVWVKEPDPSTCKWIVQIFEEFATGKYSLRTYEEKLDDIYKEYWIKLSKSWLERALKRVYYTWYVQHNWELFKWLHKPIITKRLFDKVQNILNWRHRVKKETHNFLFRWRIFTVNGNMLVW